MLARLRQLDPSIRDLVVVDTEFVATAGEPPVPVCLAARELEAGKLHRIFFPPPGEGYAACPFSLGRDRVFVAFNAVAEFSTFLVLGWELPARTLDLYAEWLHVNNEESKRRLMKTQKKNSLLAACLLSGIVVMNAAAKEEMRRLILRGHPYSVEEQARILDYCQADVESTTALLQVLAPRILFPQAAIVRGRYMRAVARMEQTGIPIDVPLLTRLQQHWPQILEQLIARVNADYGIYEGTSLKHGRLEAYLAAQGIQDFPRTPTGRLEIKEETVSRIARLYPQLKAWAQLLSTLSQTRLGIAFPVGRDGRCRAGLWPFASVTGRNQPSNKQFPFGVSSWLRHLIKPASGRALIYLDWSAQEFHIAAHLSGDTRMKEVLAASDPYLKFAEMAHAVPVGATKATHGEVRAQYKALALGVMYGKTMYGLARDLQISETAAEELMAKHRMLFARFWRWLDLTVSAAVEQQYMTTKLGWVRQVLPASARSNGDRKDQMKSLQNQMMQATGAEMMRLASCYGTEAGMAVCAPVHNGFLIEAAEEDSSRAATQMAECMRRASQVVLGAEVPVEIKPPIFYPQRFVPEDRPEALKMWSTVMELLEILEHALAYGEQQPGLSEVAG